MSASNVVKLPTASPRKVQQRYNRESRAEMARLRTETQWPHKAEPPTIRIGRKRAELISRMDTGPDYLILMAILGVLTPGQQLEVRKALTAWATVRKGEMYEQALASVISHVGSFGERFDIQRALDEVRS
ncbi:hypothetical protein [Sphingomonas sanxanigenens]|uniref:Uncharacterized protein n=1 Tax=Sphingomonas sanxanigenens DSM 19645 = NX02 TaxID=1123269 RepID=W0A8Z3_9SPHN|nr:hypothetical protein [Sphingomonas sanxanigenens]AHE52813.1 hypothetical protein NX02_05370 [Sphingomonas sanxanigenens DSM 19645 = NX02]